MDKLKHGMATTFNKVGSKAVFLTTLAVGITMMPYTNNDFDDYSTPQTEEVFQNINEEMAELQRDYNEIEKNTLIIQSKKNELGEDELLQQHKENNAKVDKLTSELKDFEYNLMFSGLSESNIVQVIEEYNGLKISNLNSLTDDYYMDNFNETINSGKIDSLKYPITKVERHEKLDKTYKVMENINENDDMGSFFAGIFSAVASFIILGFAHDIFAQSKTLKKWNEIQPTNRKRKKLSPKSSNNGNKRSL